MILKKLQTLLIVCLLSISSIGITEKTQAQETDYQDQVIIKGFTATEDGVLVSPKRYRKYSLCDDEKTELQKFIDKRGDKVLIDDGFDGFDIVYAVILAGLAGYVIHDIKIQNHPLHLSMPLP